MSNTKKVLLVDDNDQNLYLIEVLLKSHDFKVVTAKNGKEALEIARKEVFFLIISDILMPVMDGFALCREWKQDDRLKTIPFVFYTATYTEQGDETYALSIGADKFIRKPMEPDLFLEQIERVLRESQEHPIPIREPLIKDEDEGYKLYSERLVHKLEKKMIDLEAEIESHEKTEKLLRDSEKKFKSVFHNAHIGIVIANKKGELEDFNDDFRQILGYEKTELIGMNFAEFTFPADLEKENVYFEKIMDGSLNTFRLQKRYVTKDKEIKWIEITVSAVRDSDGEIIQLIGMVMDIDEQKKSEAMKEQLEMQLRQSQKMEAIGNLAGGIAHDFNNILSAIIGYTELSMSDVEKGSNIEGNLAEIYNAGKRARDLVKQILTFARKTDEKIKPIRPDETAIEVIKLLKSTTPASIEIRTDFDSSAYIMGNAIQLHQVFMNLCTNAIQSMEDAGGVLQISMKDHQSAPMQDKTLDSKPCEHLLITVSDTGSGIPEHLLGSVFDPYFTTKTFGSGTGLGLSTVHGIVKRYGGDISVTSKENKGTTFAIYFPVVMGQGKAKFPKEGSIPKGSERILFVDDEPSLADIGGKMLTRLGYTVTAMTSSIEALDRFRSNPDDFDLVITDMTMPKLSGDVFSAELVSIKPGIPIIILTGYSKKMNEDQAAQLGIKAFAYKPLALSKIAGLIRDVLES